MPQSCGCPWRSAPSESRRRWPTCPPAAGTWCRSYRRSPGTGSDCPDVRNGLQCSSEDIGSDHASGRLCPRLVLGSARRLRTGLTARRHEPVSEGERSQDRHGVRGRHHQQERRNRPRRTDQRAGAPVERRRSTGRQARPARPAAHRAGGNPGDDLAGRSPRVRCRSGRSAARRPRRPDANRHAADAGSVRAARPGDDRQTDARRPPREGPCRAPRGRPIPLRLRGLREGPRPRRRDAR